MKSINESLGQELQWIHPKMFSGEYELRGSDELFARIRWKGTFMPQVFAETANGNWKIKQKGMGQTITVLALDSETVLASVKRSSRQATLFTFDDHKYTWRCTSFWRDIGTWYNNENTPLLHLRRGSYVQLEPAAQDLPDLVLLATLGWYLHKQQEAETTAASIVPIIS